MYSIHTLRLHYDHHWTELCRTLRKNALEWISICICVFCSWRAAWIYGWLELFPFIWHERLFTFNCSREVYCRDPWSVWSHSSVLDVTFPSTSARHRWFSGEFVLYFLLFLLYYDRHKEFDMIDFYFVCHKNTVYCGCFSGGRVLLQAVEFKPIF